MINEQYKISDLLLATELLTVGTRFQIMHLCRRMEDRLTSADDTKLHLIKQQINPSPLQTENSASKPLFSVLVDG